MTLHDGVPVPKVIDFGVAEAIQHWREVKRILDRMQQLTRQLIFGTMPDTRRRKPLYRNVLGLI